MDLEALVVEVLPAAQLEQVAPCLERPSMVNTRASARRSYAKAWATVPENYWIGQMRDYLKF